MNNLNKSKKSAFTLAEVLITLSIIGIVAMMTIPNLVAKYQKTIYVTQLKKSYTTLQQGLKLMMADKGVQRFDETDLFGTDSWTSEAGQTRVDTAIKKFFKILKSCKDGDTSCQIEGYKYLDGRSTTGNWAIRFNNSYNFYMADGTAVRLFFYNNTCPPLGREPMKSLCGWINIDINGKKPPNIYGRDYFGYVIGYDGTIYPEGGIANAKLGSPTWESGGDYWMGSSKPQMCGIRDSDSLTGVDGLVCAARIMENNWDMDY